MFRVGLILSLQGNWMGGIQYFNNLLDCYQKYPDSEIQLEIFTDSPEELARYRCDAINIRSCPSAKLLSLRRPSHWPRRLVNQILAYDPVLLRTIERSQLDLLTHNPVGRQNSINTLFWQPDLQHKVFPDYFSARERYSRDTSIRNTRIWGNILLSSQTAANHIRQYYPELTAVQTHVLRFSAASALNVVPLQRNQLDALYPTRDPYFFLPNQFWKHKNHTVVVQALRQTAPNIRVICTGPVLDPRDSAYVPELLDSVKQLGLEHRFVSLGMVPYSDMISLMHHAVAVLQPSTFEGWSTSVEESKVMGKQIILSDIDVHVEQAPERGTYFTPNSPEELASAMIRADADYDPLCEQSFADQRPLRKSVIEREWIGNFSQILKTVIRA